MGNTIILTFSIPCVFGQVVPLPKIPTDWPVDIQNSMKLRRDSLVKLTNAYNKRVIEFDKNCEHKKLPTIECTNENQAIDKEDAKIASEKDDFLIKFAYIQQKENEKRLNEKIYPQGKPVGKFLDSKGESGAFGENIVKNPNLNDNNTDIGTYWGGRTGNAPGLPDLKYGNKNSIPDNAIEQRLAKKYPAFNEILKKENQLKSEEVKLKKDGVTLYQEIKGKGPTATQDDWNKLKKITNNLEKVNEDLKKATEQKEKIKKDYTVADTFQ